MDSFAHVWVTVGVIAAGISVLIFESLSIRGAHIHLTELHPRSSEGVFTHFLVMIGTVMALLYVVVLFAALSLQISRVFMVS